MDWSEPKCFFAYLKEGKYVSNECPFFSVKFGKTKFVDVKRKFKDILSPDEEELVINAGRNLQEKFMLAMALKTALRRSEIAGIKMSDINGCEITITGKVAMKQRLIWTIDSVICYRVCFEGTQHR